jgi:glycosyltransferase involved in cell wall biosynthesis
MAPANGSTSSPVIITGMHRSGTSLIASYLNRLGVHVGDRLWEANRQNPKGYFEDADFVDLQWKMLEDATPEGDGGHRDWGWTESERLDRGRLAAHVDAARGLLAARAGRPGLWGWKDPRTSILLDFWDDLLGGEARYVFLYRFPWEVADSMQRTGGGKFLNHPEYAPRMWAFYNRHLLDFQRRHPDRVLLASSNAVTRDPGRFVALLREKLGLAVNDAPFEGVWDPNLFASLPPGDPLASLFVAASPECGRVLAELDARADLPAAGLWSVSPLDGRRWRPEGPVDLTVVIPCYNYGELLVDAVASVERTAPERCEMVIVNDGSTQPRTLEVLAVLRQAGYPVVDQPNGGLAAARNRGVREARGRYVFPLDADNRLAAGSIASAIRVLDAEPEVGVVYGDRLDFGLRSGRLKVQEFDLPSLLWSNFIDACAAYRREIWEACGGYDDGARVWEDWELWVSAAERGWRFHRLPEVTFEYRVRPNSMLMVAEREESLWPVREYVYRKHRALYERHLLEVLRAGLLQVQAVTRGAIALRDSRDHLQVEIDRMAASIQPLREHRDAIAAEQATWAAERAALAADRDAWREQAGALERELASLRRHVGFMEGTRAWRLRDSLVRLKQRFRRG